MRLNKSVTTIYLFYASEIAHSTSREHFSCKHEKPQTHTQNSSRNEKSKNSMVYADRTETTTKKIENCAKKKSLHKKAERRPILSSAIPHIYARIYIHIAKEFRCFTCIFYLLMFVILLFLKILSSFSSPSIHTVSVCAPLVT